MRQPTSFAVWQRAVVFCVLSSLACGASAQVSLTTPGVAHTENFNSLIDTGTATWTNNSTLPGWFHARTGTGVAIVANNGGSNGGNLYSYGSTPDRALGSLGSGNALVGNLFWGIRLQNNTGVTITDLQVSYVGEQWRNSAAAAQAVSFSYLVGSPTVAGTLIEFQTAGVSVPALNFTSPITGGSAGALDGNAAANRVAISTTITGLSIPNGTEVMLRWSDPDHSGADHGLSIDDLSITPNSGGVVTPNLTINDVAVTEGDVGTTTAQFTVSLSAAAGAGGVSFDIATADNTATVADNDYVANSLTGQTIAAGSSTFTFNVTVNGDTTTEPNETFFVNITNVTGATVGDGQGIGTINNDDVSLTPIHDIQGPGASSPIVGASVFTRGIVTGLRSNGYFIQTPDSDVDLDPQTSQGLFVFTSSAPPPAAAVGNLVQVTGTVVEFVPSTDPLQPPLTELTGPTTLLISSGNPLPAAVPLTTSFPSPSGAFDQLERLEGMRVSVASMTVVAPTSGFVNESNATATSNGVFYGVVTGNARPFREPGIQAPDPAPSGSIPPIPRFDANPELIRVDSDAAGQPALNVGVGQVVTGVVGPLDYGSRAYTVLPTSPMSVSGSFSVGTVSAPTAGEVTIASFNLERFFDNVNDPAIGEPVLTATAFNTRLNKASLAIRNHLRTPDIVGVIEVENLNTLQALATRINSDAVAALQPSPDYTAFLVEGNDVGGIDVGFLVKNAPIVGVTPRVTVTSVTQELDGTLFVNPDTSSELLNDRPPLRLNAVVNNPAGQSYPVTVIVNHLRSLIGVSDTGPGSNGWPSAGARVRAKRLAQATDLANLVQSRQQANINENIVLIGDFNAFEFNDGFVDSMGVIAGTPAPAGQSVLSGTDVVNPDLDNLFDSRPLNDRYSFVFSGSAQSLDHALVNSAILVSTSSQRIEHARLNADFPEISRNDTNSGARLSDHDPLVVYLSPLNFSSADVSVTLTDTPDPVAPGALLTYVATLLSNGPTNATDASISLPLPSPTVLVSANAGSGGSCSAGSVVVCSWPGTTAASTTRVATIVVRVPATASGTLSTTVTAGASNDGNAGNNTASTTTAISRRRIIPPAG